MNKGRLEAFSDGVLSVAITLLALVHPPTALALIGLVAVYYVFEWV